MAEALDRALTGPTIVCLQAGNVHSGAFDPLGEAIDLAHRHGAWVHVDGAFGLWAAASPQLRGLTNGVERADSWATDAHKTLNVPYDNGLAIVAHAAALHAAMSERAPYLIQDERPDPFSKVPEFSRHARGFTVWAASRSLGRRGVAEMVERLCAHARRFVRDDLSAGWPSVRRPRVPVPRRLQRSLGCHRGRGHRDGRRGSCRRSTTRCCRSPQSRPRYGFVRQQVG